MIPQRGVNKGFAAWLACFVVASACADGPTMPVQIPPIYKQECAACHTPYPPGMLPAASWQRVMKGLAHHYGSDASLEPAQVQEIATWLKAHAGTYKRVREEPPEDRITRSAWFVRKHREVEAAVWKRSSIQSAAQCSACHTQADAGRFDERQLRIPR
ncbi:diheme cytochrome c [Limnohabitans sp. G3-2]|jgi:mono/diheme cytochrome c family protein|uniref:diheme cytochrome c n=1 Tax=Limnohabitans sp. G3-2 TaxID=1100711 RepID=UPI000C1F31DD|nr:diheme cytochrome c [Limnohabitans sp. G3-2]PIT75616.1 cytochrome C [Limnohabitans sp. G3-2]